MTHSVRSIFLLSALAAVLAACGTTVAAPASEAPASDAPAPSQPAADPSVQPSVEPSTPVAQEREVAGRITRFEGIWSGPGGTIAEAIANGPSGELPTLVNGVLFRDLDGRIYIATSVDDASEPAFGGPMLEVLGLDSNGPEWDMANAELLGLEEANGIVFLRNAQVLGTLELP